MLPLLLNVLLPFLPQTKAATHIIRVGAGGTHEFVPNVTRAAVGDLIVFDFYPTNHSVIRTQYCGDGTCNPCVPWELYHPSSDDDDDDDDTASGGGGGAVASGNFIVDGYDKRQTWNMTLNDTAPFWFYCNALDSCTPNGMVGVINPYPNTSIASQIRVAKSAPYQLAPGEPWPAEGTPAPTSTTSSSAHHSSGSSSLSGGAIAGIVVGVVAFVTVAAALFFFIGRSRTYSRMFKHPFAPSTTGGAPSEPGIIGAGGGAVPGPGAANPWFFHQQQQQQQQGMPSPPHSPPPGMGFQEKQLNPQRWSDSSAFSGSYPAMRGASPPPPVGEDPGQGMTFVGYNRQTGAPEFVAEVPGEGHEVVEMGRGSPGGGVSPGRGGGGGGVGGQEGGGLGGGGNGAEGREAGDGLKAEVSKGETGSVDVVASPAEMDADAEAVAKGEGEGERRMGVAR